MIQRTKGWIITMQTQKMLKQQPASEVESEGIN